MQNKSVSITTLIIVAVAMLVIGGIGGFFITDNFLGYGAIDFMEVVISDSTDNFGVVSLGNFQVHETHSWLSLEGNHIQFIVTQSSQLPLASAAE